MDLFDSFNINPKKKYVLENLPFARDVQIDNFSLVILHFVLLIINGVTFSVCVTVCSVRVIETDF